MHAYIITDRVRIRVTVLLRLGHINKTFYCSLIPVPHHHMQIRITGPAAKVMTVRVAVTQKLREKIPTIAAVQLL